MSKNKFQVTEWLKYKSNYKRKKNTAGILIPDCWISNGWKEVGLQMVQIFGWDPRSRNPAIWNQGKWQPFCKKKTIWNLDKNVQILNGWVFKRLEPILPYCKYDQVHLTQNTIATVTIWIPNTWIPDSSEYWTVWMSGIQMLKLQPDFENENVCHLNTGPFANHSKAKPSF